MQDGASFALSVDGTGLVAGLRTTKLEITGQAVAAGTAGAWRTLLDGVGSRHVTLSGAGVFTGSDGEARVKAAALAGAVLPCRAVFDTGATLAGPFVVTRLDYAGTFGGEGAWGLTLESAGPVVAA